MHSNNALLSSHWELNLNCVPLRDGTTVTSWVVRMSQTAALITTRCPEAWKAAPTLWSATASLSKRCTTVEDRTSNSVYPHCHRGASPSPHSTKPCQSSRQHSGNAVGNDKRVDLLPHNGTTDALREQKQSRSALLQLETNSRCTLLAKQRTNTSWSSGLRMGLMAATLGAGSSKVRTTDPVPTSISAHGVSSSVDDTTMRVPKRSKSTAVHRGDRHTRNMHGLKEKLKKLRVHPTVLGRQSAETLKTPQAVSQKAAST